MGRELELIQSWWKILESLCAIRVDQLITDRLPTTEHLFISSSYVLKRYESATSSSKSHFEVQRKRINEKIMRRKISFLTYKSCFFFFFLLFGPFLLLNLIAFLFLIHFKMI
jgi:hypothetical protein